MYKNAQPDFNRPNTSNSQSNAEPINNMDNKNDNETIDLTKKKINQSTLLIGSSLFKGIKNGQLKPNATVRSFPGASADTIGERLSKYDISSCIILHVGGNDADNGTNPTDFSKNYVSLLNNLESDNRRIIVSGLLPRESVDLKPYNMRLKSVCEEKNIEFIDNYDSFLLASGELPSSFYQDDKLHLKPLGTRGLLSNIDKILNVCKGSSSSHQNLLSKGNHGISY